ncbi:MAG TPA: hypothetical protein VK302_11025 [Terriglobales bacterium]|nr:hypothetical protein [Terriglobales bacterium]
MSKKDPVLVALGESPEAWSVFLWKTYGIAEEPQPRYEIGESSFVCSETGQTVPLSEIAGARGVGSHTQQTDALQSLHLESGANANVKLSPAWLRYLEYMDVIAEAFSPKDKGAALKQLALTDARSRLFREQPPERFQPMNASLGTPAEFRERWVYGELEIRVRAPNRRDHVFEIWRLPPAEPEDLDEAGEPSGQWCGPRGLDCL